jgi:hypothetical protein
VATSGDRLQQILFRAASQALTEFTTLCISMADRKVYVGWVVSAPTLRLNDTYIALVPIMSGHRDSDSLRVEFDVSYPIEHPVEKHVDIEDTMLVLPIAEVHSARLFDFPDDADKAPEDDEDSAPHGTVR